MRTMLEQARLDLGKRGIFPVATINSPNSGDPHEIVLWGTPNWSSVAVHIAENESIMAVVIYDGDICSQISTGMSIAQIWKGIHLAKQRVAQGYAIE